MAATTLTPKQTAWGFDPRPPAGVADAFRAWADFLAPFEENPMAYVDHIEFGSRFDSAAFRGEFAIPVGKAKARPPLPLSEETQALRDWVESGALDRDAENPARIQAWSD